MAGEPKEVSHLQAIACIEEGRFGDANAVLRSHLCDVPGNPNILALLSDTRDGLTDDQSAVVLMERASAVDCCAPTVARILARSRLRQGRLAEADSLAATALAGAPDDPLNLVVMAALRHAQDSAEAALVILRRALAVRPFLLSGWRLLASLYQQGRHEAAAIDVMRRSAVMNVANIAIRLELADGLRRVGGVQQAETILRRVVAEAADNVLGHFNLAVILHSKGCLIAGAGHYRLTMVLMPGAVMAYLNHAAIDKAECRYQDALRHYGRVLALDPAHVVALNDLGNTLRVLGRLDEAIYHFSRAVELRPDLADLYTNLAGLWMDRSQYHEASGGYRRGLVFRPEHAETLSNLALAYHELGLVAALPTALWATRLAPRRPGCWLNLGSVLQGVGRLDDAALAYEEAIAIDPDYGDAYSNLLFCLTNNPAVGAADLFRQHRRFGKRFDQAGRVKREPHSNSRDPRRVVRIGFLSGDFGDHPVALLLEPVVAHLAGNHQFLLHAYVNCVVRGGAAHRILGHFAHWTPCHGLSDDALADQIHRDRIDILIDLSGHTARNRLVLFSRKLAPVQASWLGYLGTTGLESVDYYFSDRYFSPIEEVASQFTEKILHLPAVAAFVPFDRAPPVNGLPALHNGFVTFGSFNNLRKVNRPTVAAWSSLLRALPNSRLMIGGMPACGEHPVIDWFLEEGISGDRLVLYRRCDLESYLSLHQQVDICLDTFPYGGGMTTNHALWMGVPVLTIRGDTPASRIGGTFLRHVGLDDFVTADRDGFVEKALHWAAHLDELAEIRSGLRGRVRRSPLGNAAMVSDGLQQALRQVWVRWCSGLPPAHIVEAKDLSAGGPATRRHEGFSSGGNVGPAAGPVVLEG